MKKIYLALCISASLALTGCGGGESSSESNTNIQTPTKKKSPRDALTAQDKTFPYFDGKDSTIVNNVFGELTFRLVDGEPTDVVVIDQQTGEFTVLNPGDVKIEVTDTSHVYETSTATFTLHIEKAENDDLGADFESISTLSREKRRISVRGHRGKLNFSVAPESQHLLTIDSETGEISPLGDEGQATIIIRDEGNRRYQPKTIRSYVQVEAVTPGELQFADLKKKFTKKMVLKPKKISDSHQGTLRYALNAPEADSKVLTINATTGVMDVVGTGNANIKVTQTFDKGYVTKTRTHYFNVEIEKGTRPALKISNKSFVYDQNKVLTINAQNVIGNLRYNIESGYGVLEIDSNTGKPKIVGVGTAEIRATDDSDPRFESSETTFQIDITPAQHPGLTQEKLEYDFTENAIAAKKLVKIAGQQGRLTMTAPNSNVVAVHDQSLVLKHAGHVDLNITDDGGALYRPTTKKVTVTVLPAPHPQMTVTDINAVYGNNLCIPVSELDAKNVKGSLTINSVGDESVVKFDKSKSCFSVLKAGSANFTVTSSGNGDYKASKPVSFSVAISPADSSISVKKPITEVFRPGGVKINAPAVIGQKGTLTYEVAPNATQGVVSVNPKSGEMTILKAGSTTINVTDSDSGSYKSATTNFSVRITKAQNLAEASYPAASFAKSATIKPVVKNAPDNVTYKVVKGGNVVALTDANSGVLAIKAAGNYEIEVKAKGNDNYLDKTLYVTGTVAKAMHPGIKANIDHLYYKPEMEVELKLPTALGKRSYALDFESGDYRERLLKIENPNVAKVRVMDYSPRVDIRPLEIKITEEESENYLALTSTDRAVKRVRVLPPQANVSDQDLLLDKSFTIVDNNLNNNVDYINLEDTQVRFAGAVQLPSVDHQSHSIRLGVIMKPLNMSIQEAIKQGKRASVTLEVNRYEGCADKVNIPNLGTQKPVSMKDGNVCKENVATNRYLTFNVVDTENLGEGEWGSIVPFVSYYYSPRPFIPTWKGGFYVPENDGVMRREPPKKVITWNRILLKVSK